MKRMFRIAHYSKRLVKEFDKYRRMADVPVDKIDQLVEYLNGKPEPRRKLFDRSLNDET